MVVAFVIAGRGWDVDVAVWYLREMEDSWLELGALIEGQCIVPLLVRLLGAELEILVV